MSESAAVPELNSLCDNVSHFVDIIKCQFRLTQRNNFTEPSWRQDFGGCDGSFLTELRQLLRTATSCRTLFQPVLALLPIPCDHAEVMRGPLGLRARRGTLGQAKTGATMKKQRKRPAQKKQSTAAPAPAPSPNRRALLRNGLIIAGGLGIGGFFATNMVMATIAEHDLTRVGQGIPMIVQVHDPQCPSCQELQREARAAMKAFDETDLQYAVANITSDTGAAFANAHGAPHITLLLFDGAGNLRNRLNGIRPRAELEAAFAALVAIPG